jgi:hypothetical protein
MHGNKNNYTYDHFLTPDERALYIRQSIQGYSGLSGNALQNMKRTEI